MEEIREKRCDMVETFAVKQPLKTHFHFFHFNFVEFIHASPV